MPNAIADELSWLSLNDIRPDVHVGSGTQPHVAGFESGALIALIWIMAVVGTLFYGPQPRYATKWAWFWPLWLPYGIGWLALVLCEAPWSKRASAKVEPLPHDQQRKLSAGDRRLTGGWAWLIAFIVAPWLLSITG